LNIPQNNRQKSKVQPGEIKGRLGQVYTRNASWFGFPLGKKKRKKKRKKACPRAVILIQESCSE
jgi:hypothetical protein